MTGLDIQQITRSSVKGWDVIAVVRCELPRRTTTERQVAMGSFMKVNDAAVIVEETFNRSATTVWNAITAIDEMRQWYFDNIPAFEARVGFETRFIVTNDGRIFLHRWKVTDVVPLKKISYNWRFDGYPGDGLVTFELTEQGSTTTLNLSNTILEDFPDNVPEFKRENCLAGWQYFIGQSVREYLEGGRNSAT